jgi:hypothetical protein
VARQRQRQRAPRRAHNVQTRAYEDELAALTAVHPARHVQASWRRRRGSCSQEEEEEEDEGHRGRRRRGCKQQGEEREEAAVNAKRHSKPPG